MTRNNADFGNGASSGRSIIMYHGTSKANAESIMKNGFKDNTHLHPDDQIAADYGSHIIKVTIPDNLVFESPHYHEQDHEAKEYGEGADGTYDRNYYTSKDDPGSERVIYKGSNITPVSMYKNPYDFSAGFTHHD